jgi:hypothetical protein
MKVCEFATDQQLAIFALLVICTLSAGLKIDGSKELFLTVAGAIAGWMSKSVERVAQ